jgi:glycosyltransferase involved in cell wall biosynthesis
VEKTWAGEVREIASGDEGSVSALQMDKCEPHNYNRHFPGIYLSKDSNRCAWSQTKTVHFMNHAPAISIITPSRNHAKALEATIQSIQAQAFADWEHIVIDAASTDETLEILKKYPHVRYLSEPDKGFYPAISKGLRMARGKYIMTCLIWDTMEDKEWLQIANDLFEQRPEVALIHARSKAQDFDGEWSPPYPPEPFTQSPPQLTALFYYYLLSPFFHFNDLAFIARREIWDTCLPKENLEPDGIHPHPGLTFCSEFHRSGYLAWFVPRIVTHGLTHPTSLMVASNRGGEGERIHTIFRNQRRDLRKELLTGRWQQTFRMADGSPHPAKRFSRFRFMLALGVFKLLRLVRNKLMGIDASYRNPSEIHRLIATSLRLTGLWES